MEHSTTAPPPWEVYRDLDPSVPLSLSSIIFPIICPFCCQTLAMAGTQGQLFPLPLSLLNKRQSHRLNANWLNCTLEFSRRKTYLLGERWKKDLLICLPGVTLKHCFLAGLTLSIDHIFLLCYGKHASTISFFLYSSSQVERWSTLIDVAVVLLSYSPNYQIYKSRASKQESQCFRLRVEEGERHRLERWVLLSPPKGTNPIQFLHYLGENEFHHGHLHPYISRGNRGKRGSGKAATLLYRLIS